MNLSLTAAKQLAKKGMKIAAKNLPAILAAVSATGVISTAISASKAKPKADEIIKEHKERMEEIENSEEFEDEKEYKQAKLKVYFNTGRRLLFAYLPTIVIVVITIMCIFGAHHVNLRRQAALTAAYSVTEKAFLDYKDQVKNVIGPKKEDAIREKVAEKRMAENPPKADQVIFTGNGDVLCYDMHTGRYFRSNPEFIREKIVDLNTRLIDEMFISLNDYYDEIGLARVELGNEIGWNIDRGKISPDFTSSLIENIPGINIGLTGLSAKTPILCISFDVQLRYNYFGEVDYR